MNRPALLTIVGVAVFSVGAALAQTTVYPGVDAQSQASPQRAQSTRPRPAANQNQEYLTPAQRQFYRESKGQQDADAWRRLLDHQHQGVYNNGLRPRAENQSGRNRSVASGMAAEAHHDLQQRFNPQDRDYGTFWRRVENGMFFVTIEDWEYYAFWGSFIGLIIVSFAWYYERRRRFEDIALCTEISTFLVEQNSFLKQRTDDAVMRHNALISAQRRAERMAERQQLPAEAGGSEKVAEQNQSVRFDREDSRSGKAPAMEDVFGPATPVPATSGNGTAAPNGSADLVGDALPENAPEVSALRKRLESQNQRIQFLEGRLQNYED